MSASEKFLNSGSESQPRKPTFFEARYHSKCPDCGDDIVPGETVGKFEGDVLHEDCAILSYEDATDG